MTDDTRREKTAIEQRRKKGSVEQRRTKPGPCRWNTMDWPTGQSKYSNTTQNEYKLEFFRTIFAERRPGRVTTICMRNADAFETKRNVNASI